MKNQFLGEAQQEPYSFRANGIDEKTISCQRRIPFRASIVSLFRHLIAKSGQSARENNPSISRYGQNFDIPEKPEDTKWVMGVT